MLRWYKLCLTLCFALASGQAFAQINGNLLMPPPVDMTKSGWDATLQLGSLTFGLPVTSVPGEIPIQVSFGMNAAYSATTHTSRLKDLGPPISYYQVVNEIDRPMVGGIHFGYIADPSTYSGTNVEGVSVLEDGYQVSDSQWTAFSSHANLGTVLNLPQAYGFAAVSISTAKVDPAATYLSYTTTLAGLSTACQNLIANQGLSPSGFGAGSTSYKVVMDKNKARVFAYATSVTAWVPIIWVDRFGHSVTFQWVRSTTGLPAGITAITKVTATNQRSKGVVLRWADYSSNASVVDILRVDPVGIHTPSVVIKGYPSYASTAPAGYGSPFPTPDNLYIVVPSPIGSTCRPTNIQLGPFASLTQPSWSGSGSTAATAPGAPPVDGTSDSTTRTWTFGYDSALAELSSITQPNGLTTSFFYANAPLMLGLGGTIGSRGVYEVHAVDANGSKLNKRWTRTYPAGSTPMSIKVEGWWDPSQMVTPDRYHQIVLPTDTLNYGNGVYQSDTLLDTAGKTWSATTYSYSATGAGLNAGLSSVQSVSVQQDGGPTITTALGYPDSSALQVTQQNVSAKNASGVVYQVSTTTNTYGTHWDMLEGHQLLQAATTRYAQDGVTSLATVTQKNEYDTSSPTFLQLQKSYLEGGSVGKHGTSYSYDADGRPYVQQAYHVEGALSQSSPNYLAIGYDSTTGAQSSQSLTNVAISPNQYLTATMGGFDSAGRATTTTDAAGIITTFTFDDRGRSLSKSRAGSLAVSIIYPSEFSSATTVNGMTTTTIFDGFGRVSKVYLATGINSIGGAALTTQDVVYDQYSRRLSLRESNPAGTVRSQSWTYDALDRVTSQTPAIGGTTTVAYAASGINSKVTTTLSNQVSTSTFRDPFGQVVEVDAPDGSVTKATFDGAGNQVSVVIQPATGTAQTRSWTYDALGRLTSKTEPETNTQAFSAFNALNQPTSMTEASGTGDARTRTLSYDGFGRMQGMANGSDSLAYTYSGPNLSSTSRTVGGTTVSQNYAYNGPGGRLSSESTIQPGLTAGIGYTYDAATGFLTSLSYPSGRVVGYAYDALGRATSITNNSSPLVSTIKYDDWGNRSQVGYASGSQDQWVADLTGTRLTTWSIGYVGGGPDGRGYTYDDATNILKTAGEWALTHDTMGRLTEADGFGIKTAHSYDAFGNATNHLATANGSPVPPAFNNFIFNPMVNNQIPGQEQNGALTGWSTNLRGEATQVGTATSSGTALGLGWDGLGLVKSVAWSGGSQSYLYAPSGQRISLNDVVTSANNRKYAYNSGGMLLGEYGNQAGPARLSASMQVAGASTLATATTSKNAATTQATSSKAGAVAYLLPGPMDPAGAYIDVPLGPTTIVLGQTITFEGSTDFGTTLKWTFGDGTSALGSMVNHTYAAVGTYTVGFLATAKGYSPSSASVVITVVQPAGPGINSFTTSASTIPAGGYADLSWTTSNATSANISGVGAVAVSGTTRVWPAVNTTYVLTVNSPYGTATATVAITVVLAPVIRSFIANPTSIQTGQYSQLSWTVDNATSYSLDQGIGTVPGTWATVSPGVTTTFTLTATNQLNGVAVSRTATASVTLTAPPPSVWTRDVIYLGSQAIAEVDANGVHELHSDHLGSPRLITKGSGTWASNLIGTAEATQAYGSYGELLQQTGSYVPLTGYTGHLQTDASGLIYMRGRYYSPAWHAFVNSDQGLDPSTFNQRAYVGGSPFHGTDPSGMMLSLTGSWDWLFGGGNSYEVIIWGKLDPGGIPPSSPWLAATDPWFQPLERRNREGSGGSIQPQSPKPKVDCNTVLPDGRTVGQVVQQQRAIMANVAAVANSMPSNPYFDNAQAALTGAMYSIAKSNGPIDFKRNFRGQADANMLGQAGNFAYYAIGSGLLPTVELDAGAGAYAIYSFAFGSKKLSDLTPRFGIDKSAASVRDAALAANGCK